MPFKPMLQKPSPKKLSKTSLPLDPIYYTNVWDHPKQQLNHFNDYIPAVYEPECSDGGDIGPRGDGDVISVGDTGASAFGVLSIGASAAVVNLTGIGQPPRDGEAIGDASRDHSKWLAADIMTGRIAYNRPFSGVIAGVPIPV